MLVRDYLLTETIPDNINELISASYYHNTNTDTTASIHSNDCLTADSRLLFFDIETTGLSAKTGFCYLIGCVYFNETDKKYHYIQWFAEEQNDEPAILNAFCRLCKDYSAIIHFNGDSFDIPYIKERCRLFDISSPFDTLISIDLYKYIRNNKKILKLENCRQKTLEQFLGIDRIDKYSGGELISLYKKYFSKNNGKYDEYSKEVLELLMLHNHDDICALPFLTQLLSYNEIFKGNYEIDSCIISESTDYNADTVKQLIFTLTPEFAIPKEFALLKEFDFTQKTTDANRKSSDTSDSPYTNNAGSFYIKAEHNSLKLCVPVYFGELKYFYANYKDYFYIPDEDRAIHKSIAAFVDKNHRTPAAANTCYTKKNGCFAPQTSNIISPAFKFNYKDPISYFEISENVMSDKNTMPSYVRDIINYIIE